MDDFAHATHGGIHHKGWWFAKGLTPYRLGVNDWGIGLGYAGTH